MHGRGTTRFHVGIHGAHLGGSTRYSPSVTANEAVCSSVIFGGHTELFIHRYELIRGSDGRSVGIVR